MSISNHLRPNIKPISGLKIENTHNFLHFFKFLEKPQVVLGVKRYNLCNDTKKGLERKWKLVPSQKTKNKKTM